MQILSINTPYPFPINEGATTSFASSAGNLLQIGLHGLSDKEVLAFRRHPVKCGVLIDLPVILWLFDFGADGQYDAPFNAKLYSKEQLNLLDIENSEQRIAVEMHLVDLKNNVLKAIRLFTLPPELTISFLSATQDQLAAQFSSQSYQAKLAQLYLSSIDELLTKTKLYTAGT